MSRKTLFAAVLLTAALAIPAFGQSSCAYDGLCSCDYLNESFVDLNDWTDSGVTIEQIADPCLSFSPQNDVAEFASSGYMERTFTTSGGTSYTLEFSYYLPVDQDDWYDVIKVTVTNLDTNQSEIDYFRGSDYDTTCKVVWNLSNDYSAADVKVKFERGYLGTGTLQIDNASFWEHGCF